MADPEGDSLSGSSGFLSRRLGSRKDARKLCAIVMAFAAFAALSAGDSSGVEADEYSAYEAPEESVVSTVLSRPGEAEDFRREFGLTEAESDAAAKAVKEENERLSKLSYEGRGEVESGRVLSGDPESDVASEYNDTLVEEAGETRDEIEEIVPEDRHDELEAWMNDRYLEARRNCSASKDPRRKSKGGSLETVFATQYYGHTKFEVALPHRKLKFTKGSRVRISYKGRSVWAPVKEVGPWNTYDNYWQSQKQRTTYKRLGRGMPEAEAAWCRGYNRGKDEQGRIVRNPAGVDLTPAVARKLGLKNLQNDWVTVYYPKSNK